MNGKTLLLVFWIQRPAESPKEVTANASGIGAFIARQLDQDLHTSIKDSEYVSNIHDHAEKFDPRSEEVFKYIQVSGVSLFLRLLRLVVQPCWHTPSRWRS